MIDDAQLPRAEREQGSTIADAIATLHARLRARGNRNLLGLDVVPDVEFGSVREREDADALAQPDAAVE